MNHEREWPNLKQKLEHPFLVTEREDLFILGFQDRLVSF